MFTSLLGALIALPGMISKLIDAINALTGAYQKYTDALWQQKSDATFKSLEQGATTEKQKDDAAKSLTDLVNHL